jgi:DNA-binding CsgD family transcriptional regulator
MTAIGGEADKLLDLIGEVQGMLDLDELVEGLLAAFERNVPSDYVSINDVGPDPERVIAVMRPLAPDHLYRAFGEYAFQNPLMAYHLETLDGRPRRFSDVISSDDLHALDLYHHVYAPLGVEYQMAFTLPATPGRVLAIALSRRERDYGDEERDLIERARPFLIQAWRNAVEHTALRDELATRPPRREPANGMPLAALRELGLSRRQAEVLALVSRGRSNRDAGAVLGISERTVQKHLEHCYRVLGTPGRSAAAELVWSLLAAPPAPAPSPRRGLDGRQPAL